MKRSAGFTLIELIIACVIIAILASIAIPSYRNYVISAKRSGAKSALAEIAGRQQSYYADRNRYAANLASLGYGAAALYLGEDGQLQTTSDQSTYRISVAGTASDIGSCTTSGSASATDYTLLATPQGAQSADSRCGTLCIAASGARGASGSQGSLCWSR